MDFNFKILNQFESSFYMNERQCLDVLNHINVDHELTLIFETKEKDQVTSEILEDTPLISRSANTEIKLRELENLPVRKIQLSTFKP